MDAAIVLVIFLLVASIVLAAKYFLGDIYERINTLEERQDDLEENWDALINELKDLVKK